jgi:LPXTG-motif cell wall-anchored protein
MKGQLFKSTILMLVVSLLLVSLSFTASAATAPNLGSATPFGLMGVAISNTNPTFVAGSVGSDGQTSAPTITVGANFLNDATYHTANLDLGLAIDNANAQACTTTGQAGANLGGQTFQTGVYCYPGAVNVTGTLKLDGPGVIIFKVDGAFNTAANAVFQLSNGAQAGNVFYVVAGASTLGANTAFIGTLMSKAAITVDTSNIVGRMLSQPAVTISTSTITIPPVIQQQNLVLSALCTDIPLVNRKWNVHNPNATAVSFSYAIQGTAQAGSQTIAANSDAQITTTTEGTNVMNLLVNGAVQTFITNTGAACAVATVSPTPSATPTSTPTATPTATPSAIPSATPSATPASIPTVTPAATLKPGATPVAAGGPTPSPIATPGPCLVDVTTTGVKAVAVPAGAKLISKKTSALMIWHLPNGDLMVKATLPAKNKGMGIWTFDLGGQTYTVNGSEGVTYTIVNPPVGTYSTVASFANDCGQPVIKLLAATITVPTVTGGTLPNTATPWYNFMLVGAVMLFMGTMIWRKRKLRD